MISNQLNTMDRSRLTIPLWLVVVFGSCLVHTFNLESRLPIVKFGDPNTYFGYSVAEHVQGDIDDPTNQKWLLIGAPLGQNLQPNTTRSGALYKCPITQETSDCTQVVTDGRRLPGGAYEPSIDDGELNPPLFSSEIKNGQWMGGTVRSQGAGGKVLVCGHRYIIKSGESQHGQGLCYVLENDLEYDETYEPCKGRSTARAHEEYGYCQAGTSGTLLDDDTMVLGTPGPYTWRGTIFVIAVGGEYLKRDKTNYYGPHTDGTSPVDKYSYLGMSVTGGRYFGQYMSYASGAPRSADHGQVIIFSKGNPPNTNPIPLKKVIDGEQFASGFGYEMATADVNGDELPDLLVAAPFYFSRHDGGAVYVYQNDNYNLPSKATLKLTGKPESQFGLAIANIGDINKDGCDDIAIGAPYENNGVVYIYLGSRTGLSDKPSQIITAGSLGLDFTMLRTFGSSLSGRIDLDNNSYPDLLVGSYASSAAVVLLSRPITNIRTEVIDNELKNIDPTKTGCPKNPSSNLTCFAFKACCAIDPYESSPVKTLELVYTIEAETFNNQKKYSRVYFGPNHEQRTNIVRKRIYVKTDGQLDCHEEVVYVKENTRDIQTPIKLRLNYTIVEPRLPASGLIGLNPILDQTQADRQFEASFQKDCGTDDICQSQLEVKAELMLEKKDGVYSLLLGQSEEIQVNVKVENQEDSAYEAQVFIVHQSSVSYIAASKGSMICSRFNSTVVSCSLGNPMRRDAKAEVRIRFDPSTLEDSAPELTFTVFANSTSKQIRPQKNTVLVTKVIKKAELTLTGWARPEQVFYGGEIKGESAMKYVEDIGTSVQHTFQIYNNGPWKAPHIEVHISWPYQVANDKPQGKWLLYLDEPPIIEGAEGGECSITQNKLINPLLLQKRPPALDQMAQVVQSGFLINSASQPAITSNKSRTIAESSFSEKTRTKFSSISSSATMNRVKRDRAMIIRAERLTDKDGKDKETVHMDCKKNTAKCVKFRCDIYNMNRKTEAYIHVKARLWNATLVADYPRVDLVKIVSSAELVIPARYGIQQNKQDDVTSVETHAYPELLDQTGDGSIPIWIIILGILLGLLLLAIVVYCLWRFGFFKRRRPDPTLSGNLEKNSESKPFIEK